jgi:hypothetical protein
MLFIPVIIIIIDNKIKMTVIITNVVTKLFAEVYADVERSIFAPVIF